MHNFFFRPRYSRAICESTYTRKLQTQFLCLTNVRGSERNCDFAAQKKSYMSRVLYNESNGMHFKRQRWRKRNVSDDGVHRDVYSFNVFQQLINWAFFVHGPSRATVGPGETFSRGPKKFLRGPSGEKIFEFFFWKWCILMYFIFLSDGGARTPLNVAGPGVAYHLPTPPSWRACLYTWCRLLQGWRKSKLQTFVHNLVKYCPTFKPFCRNILRKICNIVVQGRLSPPLSPWSKSPQLKVRRRRRRERGAV